MDEPLICPDQSQIACGTRLSDGTSCRGTCPPNQVCVPRDPRLLGAGFECRPEPSIFDQAWFYILTIGLLLAFIIILAVLILVPSAQ